MNESTVTAVPVKALRPSPWNPRGKDLGDLAELTASVKEHGVLQPIVVRGLGGTGTYEVVCGHRRMEAAKAAGHEMVPAIVRPLSDEQAIEIAIIENVQRKDIHPLSEAQGYHLLMTKAKLDVARIAEKIGLSVKYVYDRVKLLSLTKDAQKAFLKGEFTAGHAILLARLSPDDQDRAMDEHGALFTDEHPLFSPDEEDRMDEDLEPRKPRSVRELQGWIDSHVKQEAAQADPMLFPELVATVKAAEEQKEKVVRITHEVMTPEAVHGGPPVILGRSWKRADGQHKSKQCDRSVIGTIVIGPGRGEALRVCTDKKRCTVHWGDLIKAAKKREAAVTKSAAKTGEDREAVRRKKEAEDLAKSEAEGERWLKARPAIVASLVAAVKRAGAGAAGAAGRFLVQEFEDQVLRGQYGKKPVPVAVPVGKSADDLVRHLVFRLVTDRIEDIDEEWGRRDLGENAKEFGVDVKKILDQAAPLPKPEPKKVAAKPATKPAKRSGRAHATA